VHHVGPWDDPDGALKKYLGQTALRGWLVRWRWFATRLQAATRFQHDAQVAATAPRAGNSPLTFSTATLLDATSSSYPRRSGLTRCR
jgi:hypothetical protein